VQVANVFNFAQPARTGYRIENSALPGKSTEDKLQTAELEKPRRSQSSGDITAAADTDHQST
jgi:hypothetical protein